MRIAQLCSDYTVTVQSQSITLMNKFLFLIRCFPGFVACAVGGSHFYLIRCFL